MVILGVHSRWSKPLSTTCCPSLARQSDRALAEGRSQGVTVAARRPPDETRAVWVIDTDETGARGRMTYR